MFYVPLNSNANIPIFTDEKISRRVIEAESWN